MSDNTLRDRARVAALPTPLATPADRAGAAPRAIAWLTARALFVVGVCAVVILSLIGIPQHLAQDGWLALIAGRLIAEHGIPTHDYFTVMSHGVRWVDQQWLAQLLMYELVRIGGLQLMTVLYVLATSAAFAGAVAAGRALGGEDLDVLAITLPGAFFYLATAVSIRTQGLAYPLFVTTLWLLASDLRGTRRARRVYWVLPLLVLWANLHGSATLGAGLAGLYGLLVLLRSLRARGLRGLGDGRALLFIVGAPLSLLATPYGAGMIHYYRVTLMNPQFGRIVTEWKPVTSVPVLAVPLFVLVTLVALATLLLAHRARSGRAAPPALYDTVVLAVLALGAVIAVRNVTWFGLALIILLPPIVTALRHGRATPLRRSRVNLVAALAALALAAVITGDVLVQPTSWFESTYPRGAIATLSRLIARHPRATILADVRYADWLIWERPGLFAGRVAYDTSFELLTRSQLDAIADLAAPTANARATVARYPIWMLYPANRVINRELLRRPGVHVVSRSGRAIIATHGLG
jgi:hypothetical protein